MQTQQHSDAVPLAGRKANFVGLSSHTGFEMAACNIVQTERATRVITTQKALTEKRLKLQSDLCNELQ